MARQSFGGRLMVDGPIGGWLLVHGGLLLVA